MPNTTPTEARRDPPFSLWLFTVTILASALFLLGALRLAFPSVWEAQFLPPLWKGLSAFLILSLLNCFVEYIFHRYVLHKPAVPLLSRFYRQHTLHHALTRIARKPSRDGRGLMFIENKYPIVEDEQHNASFFPWYTLVTFALCLSPVLSLLQWALPSFPWFFAGIAALASSLSIYEVVHAIEHWSLERWEPLLENPRWGAFWRRAYSFHLRHHAVIDCNESISGFFCLPVADWVFGTCLMPMSIYADGSEWTPDEFKSPRPSWPIRLLDHAAETAVQVNRSGTVAGVSPTRGENIALWATQALGLAVSILALALLVFSATTYRDPWKIVSFSVFGGTMLLVYLLYTLYHSWRSPGGRQVLQTLGRASAFLLVAGTYTPFLLVNMRGPWGWALFGVVWGLCVSGAVFQLIVGGRYRVTSTVLTLFLGWMVVVAIKPLVNSVPHGGVWLLLAGGICYTIGALLATLTRMRYCSAFRNAFVIGGSTCHVLAVLLFVLPHQM
jgi:hemolysin III